MTNREPITCKDCKHIKSNDAGDYYCDISGGYYDPDYSCENAEYKEPTTKNDLGVDAVSRQAVIDMTGLSEWFDSSDSYNEFVIALSALPPVTPIRPKGHWVKTELPSRDAHECSECCGLALLDENRNEQLTDFCPYCGAVMREVEE